MSSPDSKNKEIQNKNSDSDIINDPNEIKEIASFRKPNLQGNHLGKVIMQNWNTKKNIPKDIGNCLNLPVIIDIKKADKIYE